MSVQGDYATALPDMASPAMIDDSWGRALPLGPTEGEEPSWDDAGAKKAASPVQSTDVASSADSGDAESAPKSATKSAASCISRAMNAVIPNGGILSGALNLASVTFGSGVLSFAAAFNTAGLAMAIVYLVIVTFFTIFSITLLAKVSYKTGLMSFEALARNLFGPGADIFVACVMWLLCFGGATGFVIAVGDIFTSIFQAAPDAPEFLRGMGGRRCMQSAVWLFLMLPASMPKRINSLRYISAIGVAFVVFLVFVVVGYSARDAFHDGVRTDLVMFRTGNHAIQAVGTFIFCYLNHVNAITIAREAIPHSVRRMTITATLSCCVCAVLYFLMGFFGYCLLGPTVSGNILLYFDPFQNPVFFVCFVGILIKLVASFSQNMFACRTSLFQVLRWEVDTMPYWLHSLVAGAFAVAALILGLFVTQITVVFSLVGSFCGGIIGFLIPATFYMYSGGFTLKKVGLFDYVLTYILLVAGVVAVVFGTISTIYNMAAD